MRLLGYDINWFCDKAVCFVGAVKTTREVTDIQNIPHSEMCVETSTCVTTWHVAIVPCFGFRLVHTGRTVYSAPKYLAGVREHSVFPRLYVPPADDENMSLGLDSILRT